MTVPIGGNIVYPPASSGKRYIENVLWLKLGFPVILAEDPEEPGTVRVYSTASGDELGALNEALREMWPAVIAFRVNDPTSLLVDFISTSRDARALIVKCRKWKRAWYVALVWAAIAVTGNLVWIMVNR